MALQNRVLPDGTIVTERWRGMLMGNRGGRLHDPATRRLGTRRWASKRWVSCVTQFRGRRREVMGKGYTELFFLDEVSALAAGHRPCFECRRQDAERFAQAWESRFGQFHGSRADGMDRVLHAERTGQRRLVERHDLDWLPRGAMVLGHGCFLARAQDGFVRWRSDGYHEAEPQGERFEVLTPPGILAVLAEGYAPLWHASVGNLERKFLGRP